MTKPSLFRRFLESSMIPITNFIGSWAHLIGRCIADGMQERFDEIAEEESLHMCDGECEIDSAWNAGKKIDEPKSN